MNKWLCTVAALATMAMASGCTLYFGGDDDHGDDIICADDAPYNPVRDPSTGTCVDYGGGGGCYGEPTPPPAYDWASCYTGCEGLDEYSCQLTSGCRAAYLEDY